MLWKRAKKALCLAGVTALLAGNLAGCGGGTDSGSKGDTSGADGSGTVQDTSGGEDAGASDAASGETSDSGVTFPLAENYEFTIMTRVGSDSEQDFSKKALVQRMQEKTNVTAIYNAIPDEQFNQKYSFPQINFPSFNI